MKLRLLVALSLMLVLSHAEAALRCEDAFVDQAALQQALNQKLETALDEARHLITLDEQGQLVVSAAPHLLSTLETARDYLSVMGIASRTVMYESIPAIEFLPNRSSAWNRMADSLRANYQTRLLFSPHLLIAKRATALWDSSTKTILVSRESLRVGRSERNNLEEFGHMKSELTKIESPTHFSGFFEVASVDQTLSPGAVDYTHSMELDEVARLAQNFHHLGTALERTDAVDTRQELSKLAKRGREILSVANAYRTFNRSVATRVKKQVLGSGPLLLEDGKVDPTRAFIAADGDVQVSIEQKANGTLRFRLEDNDRTSEIWISRRTEWAQLLPRLQANEKKAHAAFQTLFKSLAQEWENEIGPSLTALETATGAILEGAETTRADELIAQAKAPRTFVAPHLRRTRP